MLSSLLRIIIADLFTSQTDSTRPTSLIALPKMRILYCISYAFALPPLP